MGVVVICYIIVVIIVLSLVEEGVVCSFIEI